MSAPKPERVADDLEEVASLVPKLLEDYRWMYDAGYSGRRRSPSEGQGKGGHGDPSLAIVQTMRPVRDKTTTAAQNVTKALNLLRGASNTLKEAAQVIDDLGAAEHTPSAFHDPVPPQVTKGELARLTKAKRRREERGESCGEESLSGVLQNGGRVPVEHARNVFD